MGKVSIKKNVKPKQKQKQKQKQTQNVTVNIGSISKKRTRTKKSQPPQPPSQPSIISYNQPIFKQSPQQPSSLSSSILATQQPIQPPSLSSSILATQSAPNIVATENRNESALTRALVDQNTNTDTNPEELENDLERRRNKRIEKLDQPKPVFPSFKKINKEARDPIRTGLLGQIIDDKGDDTEEINALIASSAIGGLFRPTPTVPNPLRVIYDYTPTIPNPLSRVGITSSSLINYLDSFLDEEQPQPKPQP